jgi:hypothetical protein
MTAAMVMSDFPSGLIKRLHLDMLRHALRTTQLRPGLFGPFFPEDHFEDAAV